MNRRLVMLAAVVIALTTAGRVTADPPPIGALSSTATLSADDRARIETFAGFWTDSLLKSADIPDDVRTARSRLLDPARAPGVSEVFLEEYSRHLVPRLETVLADGNAHTAVNAVIVLSQLGTERSLGLLLDHVSRRDEPRRHVRLAVARGCIEVLRGMREETIKPKKVAQAARRIRDAIREEDDQLTLRHLVQALVIAEQAVNDPQTRAQIRGHIVDALDVTADRATSAPASSDPIGQLTAVYPALNDLRTAFLKLDPATQRGFGRELGPCLRKLLEVANVHWSDARKGDGTTARLGPMIYLSERFLATIDAIVRAGQRSPDTRLKEAWDAGDVAQFRRDLARWKEVLDRPPY